MKNFTDVIKTKDEDFYLKVKDILDNLKIDELNEEMELANAKEIFGHKYFNKGNVYTFADNKLFDIIVESLGVSVIPEYRKSDCKYEEYTYAERVVSFKKERGRNGSNTRDRLFQINLIVNGLERKTINFNFLVSLKNLRKGSNDADFRIKSIEYDYYGNFPSGTLEHLVGSSVDSFNNDAILADINYEKAKADAILKLESYIQAVREDKYSTVYFDKNLLNSLGRTKESINAILDADKLKP